MALLRLQNVSMVDALAISALGAGAASAATARFVVEAESMTTSGKLRSDSTASGGRYVLLARNGKLSSSSTSTAASNSLMRAW